VCLNTDLQNIIVVNCIPQQIPIFAPSPDRHDVLIISWLLHFHTKIVFPLLLTSSSVIPKSQTWKSGLLQKGQKLASALGIDMNMNSLLNSACYVVSQGIAFSDSWLVTFTRPSHHLVKVYSMSSKHRFWSVVIKTVLFLYGHLKWIETPWHLGQNSLDQVPNCLRH